MFVSQCQVNRGHGGTRGDPSDPDFNLAAAAAGNGRKRGDTLWILEAGRMLLACLPAAPDGSCSLLGLPLCVCASRGALRNKLCGGVGAPSPRLWGAFVRIGLVRPSA
eukprot:365028-Chlamydomonas_euryale.AAC.40